MTVKTWTSRKSRWFPPAAVLLLLLSCSGAEPEPEAELPPGVVEGSPEVGAATTTLSPAPSSTPAAEGCTNEAMALDPARQLGTSTSADVDGDGVQDQVRIASDPASSHTGCSTFIVVEVGSGATVASPVWEIGSMGGLPQPRIHGFADLDGRPGEEVLVDEAAGASTQFVGAFVYVDDDLERITVEGNIGSADVAGAADLFPYGGSVGHVEAADCAEDGVVVSIATPSSEPGDAEEGIYKVERRFFVFDGAVLERERVEDHEVPIDELERFREYGASPFGSC